MKFRLRLFCGALALTMGMAVQAQSIALARAAFWFGDFQTALAEFRVLAQQGNAEAQYWLGLMYSLGEGVPQNDREAANWYRKAAEKGNVKAQHGLGWMYANGRGVPKDDREAANWYRKAFDWYRKAAEQGDADAQFSLGLMYANGQGVPKNDREAANWYRKAAEQGNVTAQHHLGVIYAEGQGVPKDDREAVNWYRKAAEKGNADAQFRLAEMYFKGQGVEPVLREAMNWYRKAAEQGNVNAQDNLGVMYANGQGVPKDEREAVNWFRKAAEQGNANAQINLGVMYANGRGVPKDDREAVNWYRKAAEQGHASAQFSLGASYDNGQGVPQDYREAMHWYRKAAEQGNARAQHNLGVMYAKGQGVPKDYQQAYFWFLLAGVDGNIKTVKARESVERELTPAHRAAAQAAARNWTPKTAAQAKPPAMAGTGAQDRASPAPSQAAPAPQSANSTGSGFRVARGAIVTNHHVVDGCSRLLVNGVAAQVRGSDARSDLALLNASLPGPSTSVRTQRAAIGESVAVAGYPLRGLLAGFNMTTGNLSSLSGAGGDTRLVQITAPVQPGNSGGPLLDSAGNLMGVVVSKLDAIKTAKITGDIPQNVNFAINANVLRSFLDAHSVDYETASSDRAIATTAIADKAKGFTVLVECWK